MKEKIKQAAELLKNSSYTFAFTGAGISVESGIPPFRGKDGLWSKYDPNCLDIDYFYTNPQPAWKVIKEIFYDFFGQASANAAHKVLGEMERKELLSCVVTQNIDNLHQEGGSQNVYEFHGTAHYMVCTKTGKRIAAKDVKLDKLPPVHPDTQQLLKPDFVFFGEEIPENAQHAAVTAANKADVVLVIGTTGEVMPACMIPFQAKRNGAKIIEINPSPSSYTNGITDIYLQGKAGEILPLIAKELF